jgi:hypothetical protein
MRGDCFGRYRSLAMTRLIKGVLEMKFDPQTTKRVLRIIFFILLMDVIGMSILFRLRRTSCSATAMTR